MILASIEGTIGVAVLALLMLAIRWAGDRFAEKRADAKLEKHRVRKTAAALGAKGDSEEERMRRFLEALGIPAEGVEERRPTPPPLRPAQKRESQLQPKPVPPIVARSSPPERVPPPVKRSLPPPVPKAETPPPALPVLEVQFSQLRTQEELEFRTTSSQVSAIPGDSERSRVAANASASSQREGTGGELWREALQSRDGLRSAFILQEILGPPRGLQSNGIVPSFPSS